MFESFPRLLLGLLTGIIFGFLLQKGQVAKFDVIIRQFLLKDSTVFKVMLSAVMTGSVGVYFLLAQQAIDLSIKPAVLAAVLIGGALFGIGLAIFGYCPGTSVAASGAGHKDAMMGVVGMVFGAAAYVALFAPLSVISKSLGDFGKVTLPQITQSSPWLWIAGLIAAGSISLWLLEKRRKRRQSLIEIRPLAGTRK